jgi:hypothetical protein
MHSGMVDIQSDDGDKAIYLFGPDVSLETPMHQRAPGLATCGAYPTATLLR